MGEEGEEAGYLGDSGLGVGGDFLTLQPQHQGAVKGYEASLEFGFAVVAGFGAQFDDVG